VAAQFNSLEIPSPIDPREAFFGGRTNATKLYHRCKPGEEIGYVDYTSLYPWVCKYGKFPVGHPQVLVADLEIPTKEHHPYEGLIKCCVAAPRKLYHPVLPFRSGNKLTFPLCAACVEERNIQPCTHSDEERQLHGCWTTLELYKALDLGYRVVKVYEVWHYEQWASYNGAEESGLFNKYIDCFLKLKQEANGWPLWVKSNEDMDKYIKLYEENEGICLDATKVEFNAGLRQVAKLCLNSFWGKFGQRNNLPKQSYCTKPEEYFKLVLDPGNEVINMQAISDEMVCITHRKVEGFEEVTMSTNPVIAAYTTSQARLKLYDCLELLQERVIYYDTDSVVYLTRVEDTTKLPLGDYLGQLTNEIEGKRIVEFVAAGPKQYGYKYMMDGKLYSTIKIRGLRMDSIAKKHISFNSMVKMVKNYAATRQKDSCSVVQRKIERMGDRSIVTKIVKKTYKVAYDKRVIINNCATMPFGY
ncbi:MAG: hypothetical protein GY816_08330, partial [Cytophagales bacterium]|nr:hypothetical protein [Cytophagales bacterium]